MGWSMGWSMDQVPGPRPWGGPWTPVHVLYTSGQIYFIEGFILIDECFTQLRQDFKTMYEEM